MGRKGDGVRGWGEKGMGKRGWGEEGMGRQFYITQTASLEGNYCS